MGVECLYLSIGCCFVVKSSLVSSPVHHHRGPVPRCPGNPDQTGASRAHT